MSTLKRILLVFSSLTFFLLLSYSHIGCGKDEGPVKSDQFWKLFNNADQYGLVKDYTNFNPQTGDRFLYITREAKFGNPVAENSKTNYEKFEFRNSIGTHFYFTNDWYPEPKELRVGKWEVETTDMAAMLAPERKPEERTFEEGAKFNCAMGETYESYIVKNEYFGFIQFESFQVWSENVESSGERYITEEEFSGICEEMKPAN